MQANQSNFSANANYFPMPHSCSQEEQEKWLHLPLDEKIKTTLRKIEKKEDYSDEEKKVLVWCWKKSLACSSTKKILEIREECLKVSKELNQVEGATVTIHCLGGDVPIPHFYKEVLAKDSTFLKGFFFSHMKEAATKEFYLTDIPEDQFKKLLQIWSECAPVDGQEAYELLETSNQLDLKKEFLIEALIKVVKTWSISDKDDYSTTLAFLDQINFFDFGIDALKDELVNFVVKTYLNAHRKGHAKDAKDCLNQLKEFNITSLNLNGCRINDQELQALKEFFK